jgi:hypothetical protein
LETRQQPADQSLRSEFLSMLHATVLVMGNRTDPASELRLSGTVMRSLSEAISAGAGQQAAEDLSLILAIRGRALVAARAPVPALECYRRALAQATALLARSPRSPLAGFVLATVLMDFSTSFRSEPVDDAMKRFRHYLDSAREYAMADPLNAEARGVLYARLSDMAEILERRGDSGAEFHKLAADVAADTGNQRAQRRSVLAEWGARQRFYRFRGFNFPAGAAGVLGLRYSILQSFGDAWEEVSPTKEFRTGDRIRLRIEPNTDGFFYMMLRGTSGTWKLIYPRTDEVNKGWSGEPLFFPLGGRYVFDDQPGTERLYVVFSKTPRPEWVAAAGSASTPISSEELLQRLKEYEAKPETEMVGKEMSVSSPASSEHALYMVQPGSEAGRPLVLEIQLRHAQ